MATDWNPRLRGEFTEPYWHDLMEFVRGERSRGPVYPAHDDVFNALHETSFAATKVVVIGQDPYHGPGQAHGLSFSVRPGVAHPPSLRNIFTELQDDLGVPRPTSGCLSGWAEQGVLLLNATLTVRGGAAGSHRGHGWERFTDRVIETLCEARTGLVFVLWGSSARHKAQVVDLTPHEVIAAPHPSPLSAHRGFFGSRPFSRVNEALERQGRDPIDWSRLDRTESTAR